ncbi:MAG: succinylglutamate desuccinylase/aspartoacylase family protein [Armatimonadota bacterium]
MAPESALGHVAVTLTDGSLFPLPYWQVTSDSPGESLLLTAAQHAIELQGCEILRRFHQLCQTDLRCGEVFLFPFTNIPAVRYRRSNLTALPEQPHAATRDHNLNYNWPGDADGNDTQRLAHAISQQIIPRCTRSLDLHSWSRFTAPCSMARPDVSASWEMARVLPARFRRPLPPPASDNPCMLEHLFSQRGLGGAIIELPPQWAVTEPAVRLGLQGVVNVARALGMMEGEPEMSDGPIVEFTPERLAERGTAVTAPRSGLFVETALQAGDRVEDGQPLGHLISDETLETVEVLSPTSGYLWQYGCHRADSDVALPAMHPYADEGDLLASVMDL